MEIGVIGWIISFVLWILFTLLMFITIKLPNCNFIHTETFLILQWLALVFMWIFWGILKLQ